MTFISSETRTIPRRTSSASDYVVRDGIVRLAATKTEDSTSVPRPIPVRQMSKLVQKRPQSTALVDEFIRSFKELEGYKQVPPNFLLYLLFTTSVFRNGKPVLVDGQNLSIPAVAAAARHHAVVILDESPVLKAKLAKSRKVIVDKVDAGLSVYGVSTGFGGSADTRTDEPILLGQALLQHQQSGVLPSSTKPLDVLPLQDPLSTTSMPEAWVRGAILIRMNSLIRGHSGVRFELIEKMNELLRANVTPLVPLRGTISASGDLSPLSYIAGALIGNPSIRVFDGQAAFGGREIVSSVKALEAHGIKPIPLASKEHLGILNGTAFSASVASLALNEAVHLMLLAQVLTAMGTEALAGTRASFDPFINCTARPHPGQIETAKNIWNLLEGSSFAVTHEKEVTIEEDEGTLRQDRYPLRTAPQFIGPQVEDLLQSVKTLTIECNSTTDNPLVDGDKGVVHNGGNFQAMAVTNAMEKTRLSLHHLGKLLFGQCAELVNPAMNRGLPPSLAATDPSLDYHGKGIDIATAAYVAELGYLANPVSTHIQSAEMHNQAVNSLALISARATIDSLEVLSILMSSYLYVICQALDLRSMQHEFYEALVKVCSEEFSATFGSFMSEEASVKIKEKLTTVMRDAFDSTSTMDAKDRMDKVAASTSTTLVDFFTTSNSIEATYLAPALTSIPSFRSRVSGRLYTILDTLRRDYLSGARGPAPASRYLNKTRPLYEFVRLTLGIRMYGSENYHHFANGVGVEDETVGQNVSLIHEAIRDGKMQPIIVNMFSQLS